MQALTEARTEHVDVGPGFGIVPFAAGFVSYLGPGNGRRSSGADDDDDARSTSKHRGRGHLGGFDSLVASILGFVLILAFDMFRGFLLVDCVENRTMFGILYLVSSP